MKTLAETNHHLDTEKALVQAVVRNVIESSYAEGIVVDPEKITQVVLDRLQSSEKTVPTNR